MLKLWFAIAALVLTSLSLAGCGGTYSQGKKYLDAGEYDAARQVFETILPGQSGDDKAKILGLIGQTYYGKSEYCKSILCFEDAKKADTKYGKAYLYLGN